MKDEDIIIVKSEHKETNVITYRVAYLKDNQPTCELFNTAEAAFDRKALLINGPLLHAFLTKLDNIDIAITDLICSLYKIFCRFINILEHAVQYVKENPIIGS
jgi:hypothetical protein